MVSERKGSVLLPYVRALREVRPHWPALGVIFLMGLIGIPLSLLTPVPLKIVVDSVFDDRPLPWFLNSIVPDAVLRHPDGMIWVAIAFGILAAFLGLVHGFLDWLLRESVADRMVRGFRGRMLRHSFTISPASHIAKIPSEPAYRVCFDAPALQWTTIYGFFPVVYSMITLASMLYVTAVLDTRIAMIALLTAIPVGILIHHNQRRLRGKWGEVAGLDAAAQSVVQESLNALHLVVTYGQEERERHRFLERARESFTKRIGVMKAEGVLGLILNGTIIFGSTLLMYLGIRDVQAQRLSTGDFILILAYIGQLYAPLQAIASHITSQQKAVASAERAFEALDEKPGVEERPSALPIARSRGDIRFDDVTFAYPGGEPVLQNVSFEIAAGQRIGIVGRTGAGKTTLINLLIRLFDPGSGQIRLDGVDLREYRLADLRRQFSVVSQDTVLFSGTVAENIAYADPGASLDEIVRAAEMAQAHAFISALPEGYLTKVGERGMRLSGGERQRISLARAFLKDAPILVLDEPTSALDTETEAGVIETLQRLMQGRTTIMIAHRLSTLRDVDWVLRIVKGRAVIEHNPDRLAMREAG